MRKHTVNIHEAKSQLSKLIVAAEHGDEVVIARAGVPVARVVPIEVKKLRTFDFLGTKIPDEAFGVLPDSELAGWE